MKHFAIILSLCVLILAPTLSRAQPYNSAHQIKASEFAGFTMPTYQKGDESATDVMALQYLLRNRGFYKSKVDGVFGAKTEAAVKNFQRAKGLKVDGIVGPQTWKPLLLRLKKGDRGDAVRALQIALRGVYGHNGETPFIGQEVDGVLGASTYKNLISFQEGAYMINLSLKKELKVDGLVGPRTWGALLGADFGGS